MIVSKQRYRIPEVEDHLVLLSGGANSEALDWLMRQLDWEERLADLERGVSRPPC